MGRRSPIPSSPSGTSIARRSSRRSSRAAPYRMVLPDGSDAVVGTIEEVEPNKRLVMTWRMLYDAAAAEEPPSRVEWLLTEGGDGVTKVTTIHRDLGLSPITSANVADGWIWVLQSMKTLLETGEPLPGSAPGADDDGAQAASVGRGRRGRAAPPPGRSRRTTRRGSCSTAASCRRTRSTTSSAVRTRRRTTGGGPPAAARRTRPGRRGWCRGSTPCSVTASSPCTTPTACIEGRRGGRARRLRPRLRPRGAGPGARLPRPPRRGRRRAEGGPRRPDRRRRGQGDPRRRPRQRALVRPDDLTHGCQRDRPSRLADVGRRGGRYRYAHDDEGRAR